MLRGGPERSQFDVRQTSNRPQTPGQIDTSRRLPSSGIAVCSAGSCAARRRGTELPIYARAAPFSPLHGTMSAGSIDQSEQPQREPNLFRDVVAISLAAGTLLLVVSFVTRDPADPIAAPVWPISELYAPDATVYPLNDSITNACGYWGALLVSAIVEAIGIASVVLIAGLGGIAAALLYSRPAQCPGTSFARRHHHFDRPGNDRCLDSSAGCGHASGRKRRLLGRDVIDLVAGTFCAGRCLDPDLNGADDRIAVNHRLCIAVRRKSGRATRCARFAWLNPAGGPSDAIGSKTSSSFHRSRATDHDRRGRGRSAWPGTSGRPVGATAATPPTDNQIPTLPNVEPRSPQHRLLLRAGTSLLIKTNTRTQRTTKRSRISTTRSRSGTTKTRSPSAHA